MSYSDIDPKSFTLFSGTSPAAPGTVLPLGTAPGAGLLVGIGQSTVCVVDALIRGATGGTLDIYIESSVDAKQDGTGTWYPVIHYTQLAAAGAQVRWIATLCRGFNKSTATPTAVDVNGDTPAAVLAANAMIPDALGNALRVVFVAGTLTTVGAAQTVKLLLAK